MYELHDQKDDATIDRYSIFKDGKIVLLFNEVEGGLTAKEVFEMISEYDNLKDELDDAAIEQALAGGITLSTD